MTNTSKIELSLLRSDLAILKAHLESRTVEIELLKKELREAKDRNLKLWSEIRELERKYEQTA